MNKYTIEVSEEGMKKTLVLDEKVYEEFSSKTYCMGCTMIQQETLTIAEQLDEAGVELDEDFRDALWDDDVLWMWTHITQK